MTFHLGNTPVTCADGQTRTLIEVLLQGQRTYLGGPSAVFPPGHHIAAATTSEPCCIVKAHPAGGFNVQHLHDHALNNQILHAAARPIEWYPIQSFPTLEEARSYILELKRLHKAARAVNPVTQVTP